MNAYRSLDGGEEIIFTRLAYVDTTAGTDTFCIWRAVFAGDDQVTGYGATLPQAAADLHRQRRDACPATQAGTPPPDSQLPKLGASLGHLEQHACG